MSEGIPVNPGVLRWARETAGLDIAEVVRALARKRVTEETILAWEGGLESPSYPQLEALAYKVYKRPLAIFFFPEPPEEEGIEQSFRTLPEFELQRIPARIRELLRKAKVFQLNLADLYDGKNPAARMILNGLRFAPSANAAAMAVEVRKYLGIPIERQPRWNTMNDALKFWRTMLGEHGIFVFKDTFGTNDNSPFSGFCLYDVEFPVIYVNNNKPHSRQIFTLFHELGHLLMRTGGVDTRLDEYIQYLRGDARRIEILCNQFAAEFLAPSRDFNNRTRGITIDETAISRLANEYCVSREVILRRFLDLGKVSGNYYDEMVEIWAESKKKRSGEGNYYPTKGAYLGERYIEQVISQYHQNRISLEEAADYLDAKTSSVPGIEELLFSRERAG